MSLFLENQLHERVELSEDIAKKLFRTVAEADDIVNVAAGGLPDSSAAAATAASASSRHADAEDVEDDEDDDAQRADVGEEDENAVPLKLTDLQYDKATLDATVYYATLPDDQRTASIQKPLPRAFPEVVQPHELAFMRRAENEGFLVQLLDIALYLKFEQLLHLCSAYMAVRLDEIAKQAPSIMEGAQQIRDFLHMENEWTEEEMGNLKKEMEYAKQVDPRVY